MSRRGRPMDAETRDHLADVRRKRQGRQTPTERARAAAERAVKEWNQQVPVGAPVDVRRDDGTVLVTRTRSPAWLISDHASVSVEGISGGYLLERVTPRPTLQQQTCGHEDWLDSVDLARHPIRTCSRCGTRLQAMDLTAADIADLVDLLDTKIRWYTKRSSFITASRRSAAIARYSKLRDRVRGLRRG